MKKKTWKALVAGALLVTCSLAGAKEKNYEWDFSLAWPAGNFQSQGAERFAQRVAEKTEGKLKITVHPGGALSIKGPDTLQAVGNGLVQVAEMLVSQQAGVNPLLGMDALPGLIQGQEQMRLFLKHAMPEYEKIALQNNQKILYVVPWPSPGIFSKTALVDIKDFDGKKIRAHDKPAYEFFQQLGAVPTQMPWGEVVPALAANMIDGVGTSASSGVDGKFWEFTKHFTPVHWATSLSMVTVNLDAWETLDAETQKEVEQVAKELEPDFWQVSAQQDELAMAKLKESDVEIHLPSAELKNHIQELSPGIWDKWLKTAGPKAKKIIDSYTEEK